MVRHPEKRLRLIKIIIFKKGGIVMKRSSGIMGKLDRISELAIEVGQLQVKIGKLADLLEDERNDNSENDACSDELTYENIIDSSKSSKRKTYDDEVDAAYSKYRYSLKHASKTCSDTISEEEARALDAAKIYVDEKSACAKTKLYASQEKAEQIYENIVQSSRDKFYSRKQ